MSDADALQIVDRDHDGEYCSKFVWRMERDSAYRVERGDNCLRKLVGTAITPTASLQRNLQHKRRKHA
jgi:hypothetical protein